MSALAVCVFPIGVGIVLPIRKHREAIDLLIKHLMEGVCNCTQLLGQVKVFRISPSCQKGLLSVSEAVALSQEESVLDRDTC